VTVGVCENLKIYSDYRVSNDRMVSEYIVNWKGCERKPSWPNIRRYLGTYLRGGGGGVDLENSEMHNPVYPGSDRDLNPPKPKFKKKQRFCRYYIKSFT
jgi:hypothetical protein